jgi:hypothetical protein
MYQKGTSGNPAGRPKGAVGEKTLEQKTRARQLLVAMEKHKKFDKMLDNLTDREFAMLYRDLLEYQESKMSRLTVENPDGNIVQINVSVNSDLPLLVAPAGTKPEVGQELAIIPNDQIENNINGEEDF